MTSQPPSNARPSLSADALLERLGPMVRRLEADLLERAADPGVVAALKAEHARERETRRTSDPLEVWTHFRVGQIAAAWALSLLFVRTLEDRGFIPPRLKGAGDHREQLRALAPYLGDGDYLRLVFKELTRYRGVRDVFDAAHNPVWTLGPSPEVAEALLTFAADTGEAGLGGLDFRGDSRFLGDVYERLDEGVRKRYALLQTPEFVEDFILARTLDPALEERGARDLGDLTVIDPTCGSGHFLLGAFERLRRVWAGREPLAGPETWAFKAAEQVYGVDINPYAVAIARFRLTLAYLEAAGVGDLQDARDLRLKLAVADSLLPPEGDPQQDLAQVVPEDQRAAWGASPFAFAQSREAQAVLGGRRFDVVVGNPPYITVKDEVLRSEYRERYPSASGKYQLVVPFMERFFQLAKPGGWVGAIVGNGFMKRSFGRKVIEEFFRTVDLTQIVDTSGAYIPGHGTPTVILFGRQRPPQGQDVLAVMGKRGEPSVPEDPAQGAVWSSIRDHDRDVGYEDDYLSVDLLPREQLNSHPWSLKGGGATKLKTHVESRAIRTLGEVSTAIGFMGISGEDDLFASPTYAWNHRSIEHNVLQLTLGEEVRDWSISDGERCWFPYSTNGELVEPDSISLRFLWSYREHLANRRAFGNQTYRQKGKEWYSWHQVGRDKLDSPLSITFAFVATHNHFVLDRGGKVFNRSAPIIKLSPEATEEEHLALVGYLNSSTACFWMKQVFQSKHSAEHRTHPDPERDRYEIAATGLAQLPLPPGLAQLTELAAKLDNLAKRRRDSLIILSKLEHIEAASEVREMIQKRWHAWDRIRERMITLQEEIDWRVYFEFGFFSDPTLLLPQRLWRLPTPRGKRACELLSGRKSYVRDRDHLVPLSIAEASSSMELEPELLAILEKRARLISVCRPVKLERTLREDRSTRLRGLAWDRGRSAGG